MAHLLEDETRLHRTKNGLHYRIQFFQSDHSPCPWEDSCGMVPLLAFHGDGSTDYGEGYYLTNPLSYVPHEELPARQFDIAKAIGWEGYPAEYARAAFQDNFDGMEVTDWIEEQLRNALQDERQSAELLAEVWRACGFHADSETRHGYCQGHCAELLFVTPPDWLKAQGFADVDDYKTRCGETFKKEADLYGAWAFGGSLGYVCNFLDNALLREAMQENDCASPFDLSDSDLNALGNAFDDFNDSGDADLSCWGFWPQGDMDYFPLETNHAYTISEAVSACEADAKFRMESRVAQLKRWIKNRVPLSYRADQLPYAVI